jgi:Domain of unknown function (DUF3472)/Domain of unknown function (DUF5077)
MNCRAVDRCASLVPFRLKFTLLTFAAILGTKLAGGAFAEEWAVPLAGNTFQISSPPSDKAIARDGTLSWSDPQSRFSIYFHIDRAAKLDLSLSGQPTQSSYSIGLHDKVREIEIPDNRSKIIPIGQFACDRPGYIRLELQGLERSDNRFGPFNELVVKSDTPDLKLDFVRDNKGNMFYWGRRGPSVHLSYQVPKDTDLQYGYSELVVPKDQDPIGSYFMANGFAQGYFGIQVNSETERRVLFSVWSPFQTDNPRDIPEDQKIVLLSKGEKTRTGEFGNEGSGGQSFMIYPWKSGETYRFLTEVRPEKDDKTVYTCWFSHKSDDWQLVASFQRPKTSTHLKGFHSFLESFDPSRGHLGRRCMYGNVWVRDTAGKWYACEHAKFSVDATGGGRHRLDFEGGSEGDQFWLRNCGFFSGQVKAGTNFTRSVNSANPPEILFDKLPR